MYRESRIEWLGSLPTGWEEKPLKALLFESKEKNNPIKTDFILSVTKDRGVIPYSEKGQLGNNKSDEIGRYKIVMPNDLVVNKMNIVIGSLGISKYHGALSQVYLIFRPHKDVNIRYYEYIFRNQQFYKYTRKYTTGIMELRESLNDLYFKNTYLPVPPLEEQNKIANFLDEKVAKIDKILLQERKKLLALKEVKYKVLNEIIEEHCKSYGNEIDVSLGYIARLGSGTTPDSRTKSYYAENNIDGFHWLQTGDLTNADVFTTKKYITESARIKNGLKIYSSGSLVIAMYGATIGKLGIPQFNFTCNQACCVITPRKNVNKYYLKYYLEINSKKLIQMSVGGGQPNISQQILKKFKIKLPPLNNQNEIVKSIELKLNKFNNLEETSLKYISKLEEYKKVLINDAVTGKVKIGDEYVK